MAFYLTNAPDDYDYNYVKTVQELGTVTGERGKWRVIEDSDTEGRFEDHQKPRYHSGLYGVYPANGPDAKRMGVTISTGAGLRGVGGVAGRRGAGAEYRFNDDRATYTLDEIAENNQEQPDLIRDLKALEVGETLDFVAAGYGWGADAGTTVTRVK